MAEPPAGEDGTPQLLSPEEKKLVLLLLGMAGREARALKKRFIRKAQTAVIRAIWPVLKSASDKGLETHARRDLLNRLLLSLGIRTPSDEFFETVFGDRDFSNLEQVRERVDRFRALCMLEHGNFRFGYRKLGRDSQIKKKWNTYFPDQKTVEQRNDTLLKRPEATGLVGIDASRLFALGYLAREQKARINDARNKLTAIIEDALAEEVNSFSDMEAVAEKRGIEQLTSLIAEAGIPATEALINAGVPPSNKERSYPEIIRDIGNTCITMDLQAILKAQTTGLQNAGVYLATHDLDVYVATSMRDPLHFTTNATFVRQLFHEGRLKDWKLRYFDPTQAFVADRIQKGLMECLMIKRARLTVYNAQEGDTFGKDSEAAATLAQRKPVVVYVTRLFEWSPALGELYDEMRNGERVREDAFIDALGGIEEYQVALELIRHGYDPEQARGELVEFAARKISALETRATTFREVHPLALQTSSDGVARGVIVTRTVKDTARVVYGIMLGTLEYQIEDRDANWLLTEKVTGSPVRVVTKDPILTAAFWSEEWEP